MNATAKARMKNNAIGFAQAIPCLTMYYFLSYYLEKLFYTSRESHYEAYNSLEKGWPLITAIVGLWLVIANSISSLRNREQSYKSSPLPYLDAFSISQSSLTISGVAVNLVLIMILTHSYGFAGTAGFFAMLLAAGINSYANIRIAWKFFPEADEATTAVVGEAAVETEAGADAGRLQHNPQQA